MNFFISFVFLLLTLNLTSCAVDSDAGQETSQSSLKSKDPKRGGPYLSCYSDPPHTNVEVAWIKGALFQVFYMPWTFEVTYWNKEEGKYINHVFKNEEDVLDKVRDLSECGYSLNALKHYADGTLEQLSRSSTDKLCTGPERECEVLKFLLKVRHIKDDGTLEPVLTL